TTIPTLSEWGMIITAILLGLTGFFFIKKRYTTSYLINLTSDQSGSGRGVLF
ncbi:MAG: IPTL-CTERM sorting domain-containing protein, partial [Deltaproteobacteria bacterium]|nr:IPTL-CTERM sorting domain-containing protein [Deltaproteobacteria bacterium]